MAKGGFKGLLEKAGLAEFEDKQKAPTVTPQARSAQFPPVTAGAGVPTVTAEDLERFVAHFNNLLDKANLPGPDYFEFSQVLESPAMSKFDEKTKISASFASLVTQGLTKERLIDSAQQYVKVIQKDKEGFETALKGKLQGEVSTRQTQIDGLQRGITADTQKIQDLTKAITEAQNSIQQLNAEIAESTAKIEKNGGAYLTACDSFIKKIETNAEKIQTILS
jgi:hypothetical protein